jgi:hypothetical protein
LPEGASEETMSIVGADASLNPPSPPGPTDVDLWWRKGARSQLRGREEMDSRDRGKM